MGGCCEGEDGVLGFKGGEYGLFLKTLGEGSGCGV